jgi:hypothetical protein
MFDKLKPSIKNIPTRVASVFSASARLAEEAVPTVLRPRRNEAEREKRRNHYGRWLICAHPASLLLNVPLGTISSSFLGCAQIISSRGREYFYAGF